MLQLTEKSKIYVPCPAGVVTGGAELLHQIVDIINNNGREAYIVYFGTNEHKIPSDYKKYNIRTSEDIKDEEENVIVIYEGDFKEAYNIKQAQICLWWLSVDNYFLCNTHTISEMIYYQLNYPQKYTKGMMFYGILNYFKNHSEVVSLKKLRSLNVSCNAYQSEYAKDFLEKNGFKNLHPLKDYINDDNFIGEKNNPREDIVIYNPSKGFYFTKKLIEYAPDIHWVPIKGMNREGVISLMRRAKVYVDFGFHPGKDRLPREAVTNGCCIVTGRRGSADYVDVDIDDRFKFDQDHAKISDIINLIKYIIKNYDYVNNEYAHYRENIVKEKEEFISDCKSLFCL